MTGIASPRDAVPGPPTPTQRAKADSRGEATSRFHKPPAHRFGTAPRMATRSQFVSRELSRHLPSLHTKDAGLPSEQSLTSFGAQRSSRRKNAPSFGFGTSRRDDWLFPVAPTKF